MTPSQINHDGANYHHNISKNKKIARHQMSSYGPSSALMDIVSHDDDFSNHDYNSDQHNLVQRPRRPNPDTLSYCKILPLSLQGAQTELKELEHEWLKQSSESEDGMNQSEQNDIEAVEEMIQSHFPSRLAAQSAIEEVQNEIASLAGDEEGSSMMETLAKIVSLSYTPSQTPASSTNSKKATKGVNTILPPDTNSIRKMMMGLKGYHLHLSTHRYGSHVLQTILQSAAKCLKAHDDPSYYQTFQNEELDNKNDIPLYMLLKNVADELIPHAKELSVHVCGSHVLRTLLYALSGVEVVQDERGGDKRGKPKKKKKKRQSSSMNQDNSIGGMAKNVSNPLWKSHRYKDQNVVKIFQECLSSFTDAFIDSHENNHGGGTVDLTTTYELQTLVCHPSAGPLLSILLRVLSIVDAVDHDDQNSRNNSSSIDRDYRLLGILPSEPKYTPNSTADKLVKAILGWKQQQHTENDNVDASNPNKDPDSSPTTTSDAVNCGDIIYGLSGEPTGSIFLETILRTCGSNDFFSEFCERAGFFTVDGIREYAAHNVSNFVIQTLLVTCRTKPQAELLYKVLMPCITSISPSNVEQKNNDTAENIGNKETGNNEKHNEESLLPLLLQKKRRGVLWRLTELCAKWKVGQESLLNSICVGFALGTSSESSALKLDEEGNENGAVDESNESNDHKTTKSKKRKKKKKLQSIPMDECIRKLMDLSMPDSTSTGGRISLDTNGARAVFYMLHFVPRLCGDILDTLVNKFSSEEIEKLSMDGIGSRCIMDAILSNPSIAIPPFSTIVHSLLTKMEGRWTSLSVDRVGHHTVKKIFHALPNLDMKLNLVQELGQAGMNRLNGNAMGRAVIEECSLHDFMRGGEYTWREIVSKKMKQREWLDELAQDDGKANKGDEGEHQTKKRRKRKRKTENQVIKFDKEGDGADSRDTALDKSSVVNSIMDTIVMNTSSENNKKKVPDANDMKTKRKRKRKRKNA